MVKSSGKIGEVPERSNGLPWKGSVSETVPGVRISPSPLEFFRLSQKHQLTVSFIYLIVLLPLLLYRIAMKQLTKRMFVLIPALALATFALPVFAVSTTNLERDFLRDRGDRKIVVFAEGVTESARDEILEATQGRVVHRFRHALSGDAVEGLGAESVRALLHDRRVVRIDDDVVVHTQAQMLPWGIDRADAELVWPGGNTGSAVKVGVIDTGISLSHPDLALNIKGGYNAIRFTRNANDDNGHGSHVAGTIAALNNTQGVIGMGPSIHLYAIKALSSSGSGYLSDIIEGLDWAISRDLDVVNLSLGTASNVQSFHDAITRAYNAGIVIVAAAGNSGGSVIYPAAYEEVIAVSATDSGNNIASFSSRGPEVDIAAPGVSVYSTYKSTKYATLSGTSMAAPHVAGAAALLIKTPVGLSDTDGDGVWDPSEVKAKLQASATDLGAPGFDTLFGAGLLNAFAAVQ